MSVIFWLHVVAAAAMAWIILRLLNGHARVRTPALFFFLEGAVLIGVKTWGAVALYRLRRSAVSIFLAAALLNLPVTVYDIYRHPRGYAPFNIAGMFAGFVIVVGTCLYSLYLARRGTLQ